MECVIILLVISFIGCHAIDPCTNYQPITDTQRTTQYRAGVHDQLLCDRYLQPGWYRFSNGEMPFNKCVPEYSCGTHIPIWLNGTIPSVADGVVVKKACGNTRAGTADCCDFTMDIRVQNCGTYMVYDLKPVPGCSMAYCAGESMLCPKNKYSATGYKPCVAAYPELVQNPYLTEPIVDANDFHFECMIPYPPTLGDASFEVTWLADGAPIPGLPTTSVTSGNSAELCSCELGGLANTTLSCSVTTSYKDGHGSKSQPYISNKYWIGIKYETIKVNIDQFTPDRLVHVISTIPVVCSHPGVTDCSIDIAVTPDNDKISTDTCVVHLKPTDWNPSTSTAMTSFHVSMTPAVVPTEHLTTHVITSSVNNGAGKFWNNTVVQPLTVTTGSDKKGARCGASGDPHIKTFDKGKRYDLYDIGQYKLLKTRRGSFQADIRTLPCNFYHWMHACICGIVVREGNDVISIDMCNGPIGRTPARFEIKNPAMFTHHTKIVKDPSGKRFVMQFTSGIIVKVDTTPGSLNIEIWVPGTFYGETDGLCGYFDGNPSNDLTYPNGHVDYFSKQPRQFTNAWRIPKGDSLFERIVPQPASGQKTMACTCNANTVNKGCLAKQQIHIGDICPSCRPVVLPTPTPPVTTPASSGPIMFPTAAPQTTTLSGSTAAPSGSIMFQTASTTNYPFQLVSVKPNGATATVARSNATLLCNYTMTKNPSSRACIQNHAHMEYDDILDSCISDIMFTGDFTMALSALTYLMEGCAFTKLTNPDNIVNGRLVVPPDAKACPSACSGKGECKNGTCHCDPNFVQSDCSVDVRKPPTIVAIGPAACDLTTNNQCHVTNVIGNNIRNNKDTRCVVTQVPVKVSVAGEITISDIALVKATTPATFYSTNHASCNVSTSGVTTPGMVAYKIQMCNTNGAMVGNYGDYVIYNGTCLQCQGINCTIKTDYCFINGECFRTGDIDTVNKLGACVPHTSHSQWSTSAGPIHATVVVKPNPPNNTATSTRVPLLSVTTYSHAVNYYTATKTGCACLFDESSADCACCQNSGCPCGAKDPHKCVNCLHMDMC